LFWAKEKLEHRRRITNRNLVFDIFQVMFEYRRKLFIIHYELLTIFTG
jgi:hypothetical protein